MVAPPHLLTPTSTRPAPTRAIVSSPAIVMQSAPPSPSIRPPVKSMTFSDTLIESRNPSPSRQDAAHPHVSFHNSKLKTRRAKVSIAPTHSAGTSLHKTSISSPSRGRHRSLAIQDIRPHISAQTKSSDSIPTRGTRQRPSHPGDPVSFVSTAGSVVEMISPEQEEATTVPPVGEAPKQGVLRVLTIHSIVPAPIRREATKLLHSETSTRRQSQQPSTISEPPSSGRHCFGLLNLRSRRRRRSTHTPVQTVSTSRSVTSKRKTSYVGADGREYTHRPVAGLSFLPSEMQRVNTPPMSRGKRSPDSRPKGFFFDYASPPGDEVETRRDSVAGSTKLGRVPSYP